MIAAGSFCLGVHSLLNYGPVAAFGQNKIMLVKLKTVLKGVVINLGNQFTVPNQSIAVEALAF